MVRVTVYAATFAMMFAAPVQADSGYPYASTPFGLRFTPVSLFNPDQGVPLDRLWVTGPGGHVAVQAYADGSMRQADTAALPPGVEPVAVSHIAHWDWPGDTRQLILDRAGSRLLVLAARNPDGVRERWRVFQSLDVGPDPSALTLYFNDQADRVEIDVASAGSGEVLVFRGRRSGASADDDPGRITLRERLAVGGGPSAVAAADVNGDGIVDLAVADAASNAVTVFAGSKHGRYTRRWAVPVGDHPVAMLGIESQPWSRGLERDGYDDLVVADAGSRDVRVLAGSRNGPVSRSVAFLPPGVPGRPISLLARTPDDTPWNTANDAFGDWNADGRADIIVGDPGSHTVSVLLSDRRGALLAPLVLRTDVDAVALANGSLGGDYQMDLAIADARAGSVQLLLRPGDRLIAPEPAASQLTADSGRIAWSQRRVGGRYALYESTLAASSRLPIASSPRPFRPRLGRDARGRGLASYVRCRANRCLPFVWNFALRRERRLAIRLARGCQVREVAVWRQRTAYTVASRRPGSCSRPAQGVWLRERHRRARRLTIRGVLGDLRNRAVAWRDDRPDRRLRVRVAVRGGPVRTFGTVSTDNPTEIGRPTLDGDHVYWTYENRVLRASVRAASPCQSMWPARPNRTEGIPGEGTNFDIDFAVDDGQLFYADDVAVYQVDPARIRWVPCR